MIVDGSLGAAGVQVRDDRSLGCEGPRVGILVQDGIQVSESRVLECVLYKSDECRYVGGRYVHREGGGVGKYSGCDSLWW